MKCNFFLKNFFSKTSNNLLTILKKL